MTKDILTAVGELLNTNTDEATFYQIKINGKPINFNGVRLYASIGSAKAQINKQLQYVINWHMPKGYMLQYSKKDIPDVIKLLQSTDILNERSSDDVKVLAKTLMNEMIKSGVIEIVEIV